VTIDEVRTQLRTQLLLPDMHFEIRVQEVRAWGPVAAREPAILAVFDLSDVDEGVGEVLADLEDYGSQVVRPALGFQWPVSQQTQVVATDKGGKTFILEATGVDLLRLTCQWRPRATGS